MVAFQKVRALLAFALAGVLATAPAAADPGKHLRGIYNADEQGQASERGIIAGEISGIDYTNGAIVLATNRGRVEIQVTPSTSIFFGNHGYATLADLSRGSRVQVFVSQVDGRLIAQIIRIK